MANSLFSIGYATKPIDSFIQQLHKHNVSVIADVRSVPYSTAFQDYRQDALKATLAAAGIKYVYLGKELGPRSKDLSHYDECGQVKFDRLVKSDLFQQGVTRLRQGLDKGLSIAMMCAEKDPATCHRSLLVAHFLKHELDIVVQHIDYDGQLELQDELESRLVSLQGLSADMLSKEEELEEMAYQQQVQQTSYRLPE